MVKVKSMKNTKPKSVLSRNFPTLSARLPTVFCEFLLFVNVTAGLMIIMCCNRIMTGRISEQEVLFKTRQWHWWPST